MSQTLSNYQIQFEASQITEATLKQIMDTIANNGWTILVIQKV